MRTFAAVVGLAAACMAGCRQERASVEVQPSPRSGSAIGTSGEAAATGPAAAHPLAFLSPDGSAVIDRTIGDLQARLLREPTSLDGWVKLGEAWVRRARQTSDPGHYRSAADCAEAALALAPGERRAVALQGFVLLDAHRFEEARQLGESLFRRDARDPGALGILSDALLELGRFEEAAEATQRMVDLKPNLPSYARASHLMWLRGEVERALETARLAEGAGGEPEPRAWVAVQAALMRWHRGDLDGADADLDRALALMPDYPAALAGKGRVALSRGEAAAAERWLERAWRLAPLSETAWLLGDARRARGDEAGAREADERVLRAGRAFDRRTLALFLATKGRDPDEALRLAEAEQAVRADLYTDDARAWALFRAGRIEEASAAARRATRLGTPDARLLYHAGAIRLAAGEVQGGLALVRRALKLNPSFDFTGAAEARRLLAEAESRSARQATARVPDPGDRRRSGLRPRAGERR
jgi:tetratricopeptide (TPR) repeat protein